MLFFLAAVYSVRDKVSAQAGFVHFALISILHPAWTLSAV
jgi:hypothetical protein